VVPEAPTGICGRILRFLTIILGPSAGALEAGVGGTGDGSGIGGANVASLTIVVRRCVIATGSKPAVGTGSAR
jgi:hypothetical protein